MNKIYVAALAILLQFSNSVFADEKIDKCVGFLNAALYNGLLEQSCGFSGGVKDKLKSIYSEGGCRSIVPQEKVDSAALNIAADAKKDYQRVGKASFCAKNKKQYDDLKSNMSWMDDSVEKNAPPKFKKNEDYSSVRRKLIASGWKGYHASDADECGASDGRCKSRPEMQSCAGTASANCKFVWRKGTEKLGICTVGDPAVFSNTCDF